MTVTGAEIVVHCLERLGIGTVVGIPGGAILPLYEALSKSSLRHILARHEQGAGFIAQGLARSTGKPAVCLATSGPGATNLITALADAKMDSVPLVAITAQVSRSLIGTDAFQEVDMYGLTIPVTKHNFFVEETAELFRILPEAYRLAGAPRPGPVSIDIPKDVLTSTLEIEAWPAEWNLDLDTFEAQEPPAELIDAVVHHLRDSRRPLLYVGGGATSGWKELRSFVEREKIATTTTLMGLGLLEPENPFNLGMIGMHGKRETNKRMAEADLVLALGVRFDDRATGKTSEFCPSAMVIHVDIDASEIGKNHPAHLSWRGDARRFLQALLDRGHIRTDAPELFFSPEVVLKTLAKAAGEDVILTTDVGQHQMWAAQYFPVSRPGGFLTSGGLGTMGFGLPAAIGAALAHPERSVVCLTGDGSILMNIQELATLAELNLRVTIVLFNNRRLGLVRQQQELFYRQRYHASHLEGAPDFCALARSFGLKAWRADAAKSPLEVFQKAIACHRPSLVEIALDPEELVLPMVPSGASNSEPLMNR